MTKSYTLLADSFMDRIVLFYLAFLYCSRKRLSIYIAIGNPYTLFTCVKLRSFYNFRRANSWRVHGFKERGVQGKKILSPFG